MQTYLDLLNEVDIWGDKVEGRNGVTRELFGLHAVYDLANGFPLLTTKKMAYKSIIGELLGFLRGYDNVKDFQALGCNVWNANANSDYWLANPNCKGDGDLGRIYGVQWRDFFGVDQLANLIEGIKKDPHGRRHLVTAYNPAELDKMCLPPCHMFFQVNITPTNKLDLMMYQRSADMFLGVPYNIASYSFLILILAHHLGYAPGRFIHTLGSAHIYENHFDQVREQITRLPLMPPKVYIDPTLPVDTPLDEYEPEHFIIEGYDPYPAIKADMNV